MSLTVDEELQIEKAKHSNRLREIEAQRDVMKEEKRLERSNIKYQENIKNGH